MSKVASSTCASFLVSTIAALALSLSIGATVAAQGEKQPDLPARACARDGHLAAVTALAWSPDGRVLASGSKNGQAFLWSTETGEKLKNLSEYNSVDQPVNAMAFSPDGQRVAMAKQGVVIQHETAGAKYLPSHKIGEGTCWRLAFSPDGGRIASITRGLDSKSQKFESRWGVWEASTRTVVRSELGDPRDLAFSPDGRSLVVMERGRGLRVLDSSTLAETRLVPTAVRSPLADESVAFDSAGKIVAVAAGTAVDLYDFASGRLLRSLESPHRQEVGAIRISADGRLLAAVEDSAREVVVVWDLESGQALRTLQKEGQVIRSRRGIAFSPDSTQLAIGDDDGSIRIVRVADGSMVRTIPPSVARLAWGYWRVLDRSEPEALSKLPEFLPLEIQRFPQSWTFWSVKVAVENHHSIIPISVTAPNERVYLVWTNEKGSTRSERYPLVVVAPAGPNGPSRYVFGKNRRPSIQAGGFAIRDVPVTQAEVQPHAEASLQLIFAAPRLSKPGERWVVVFDNP